MYSKINTYQTQFIISRYKIIYFLIENENKKLPQKIVMQANDFGGEDIFPLGSFEPQNALVTQVKIAAPQA